MRRYGVVALLAVALVSAAGAAEWNPVRVEPVAIGPQARRIIVGFRATPGNALVTTVNSRMRAQGLAVVQAQSSAQDVAALALRSGLAMAFSRQLTPSMHVLFLPKTLYGADVLAALAKLRADPAVAFAAVDQRRYPLALPDDPLFPATATAVCVPPDCTPAQSYANGQWFLRTPPSPASSTDNDLAATDAVSAWAITTGSSGVVIADVDTGVRFEHPDLLRAGFGGRLLPGYDFVGQDYNPNSPYNGLGTYLIANDGDGWDPDPSDPGDWLTAADEQNALFPASQCGPPADSSWHGTRVSGILGALTNNGAGIAGMSWGPWILPVRALGKCGGYDSDIISGIEWAAGMPVSGVPNNPYPANIINLSLGGSGSCPASYQSALQSVTALGVLVVASAGNGGNPGSTAPVDAPANCSASVAGVIAVAGLRNVGTKVGYSSSGPEVGVSAPAGNCVQLSGACLRSIDTTTNLGAQGPGLNGYTDQVNTNLGTSFSAPMVAGVAALMRSVNANLTPAELAARIESSATPFPPNTAGLLVCPNSDPSTGECSCPSTGQCGTGIVDALAAVESAVKPIAAVALPATVAAGSNAVFDASGSAASCNRSIASYAWSASGGVTLASAANLAQVTAVPGSTAGTLTLVVTDSSGASDTATIDVPSNGAPLAPGVPASAGSAASACPAPLAVAPAAPTVGETFAPASVGENVKSTLSVTFTNSNPFALTQAAFSLTLPANLTISSSPQTTTSCGGAQIAATYTTTSATFANAVIPANGSCGLTIPVQSATGGTYMSTIGANALTTGPAGANSATASATLTVTAPSSGGGAFGWPELIAGAALVCAKGLRARRPPRSV
ncbi:MAG TPA: S8 family serine peptidase [Steroidobacteraceae bacterium]|nr:S8 family serine peptidase [Steroidobacteraceae bacterium]